MRAAGFEKGTVASPWSSRTSITWTFVAAAASRYGVTGKPSVCADAHATSFLSEVGYCPSETCGTFSAAIAPSESSRDVSAVTCASWSV